MRDLDKLNPPIVKDVYAVGALVPFFVSACCIAFTENAAPNTPFFQNPLSIFCLTLCVVSFFLIFIPRIFKWGWNTQYFGAGLLYAGCLALAGVIPWLCVVLYGSLPPWIRIIIFLIYSATIIWWCRRFVLLYRHVNANTELRESIYVEEEDAVFYIQKADKWNIEEKLKFKQIPSNFSFVAFLAIAFTLVPFMTFVRQLFGVPFPHVFLMIGALPIVLMCLGLATRGWLIFFYYPWKIKRKTGKNVYVDMDARPDKRADVKDK